MTTLKTALFAAIVLGIAAASFAQEKTDASQPLTAAVFPFHERGAGVTSQGGMAADLVFAKLIENPDLWLLEREQMNKILGEAELNVDTGVVNPDKAIKIGQLSGAKILVTGSIFKIRDKTYLVAKVIGTETSRVLGKSVNGKENLDALADKLGAEVSQLITQKGGELVAKVRERGDVVADLRKKLGDAKRPVVYVAIAEEHVGQPVIDPAAQTEFQKMLEELGFKVTENQNDAELTLKGEGFSELAVRRGNLTSVCGRVEVKVADKKGDVLASDSQTEIAVGLAERTTGKQALQEAAMKLAERVIPKMVRK